MKQILLQSDQRQNHKGDTQMEDQQFKVIQNRLDNIIKVLALLALKDVKQEKEKIRLLDSIDFKPIEIARALNKKPKTVRGELSRMKNTSALSENHTEN
jgi:hypothetical protein